ncbi:hypothetical protein ACFYOK_37280 [Microbispora bryophytorum]|uniref:hypothetical protein n=1 Tax=Microbispora bryophytorum TaxID=1460882 RepID=UPI0033FFBCE1
MTDPAADDPVHAALSAPVYREAFRKAMLGRADELTEEERDAVRTAREVTGTAGPAYPMPARL